MKNIIIFIMNCFRYEENEAEGFADQEQANLLKLKTLIEARKKAKLQRIEDEITNEAKDKEKHLSELAPCEDIEEEIVEVKSSTVETTDAAIDLEISEPKVIPQFKVLGTNEFEKKIKVSLTFSIKLDHIN